MYFAKYIWANSSQCWLVQDSYFQLDTSYLFLTFIAILLPFKIIYNFLFAYSIYIEYCSSYITHRLIKSYMGRVIHTITVFIRIEAQASIFYKWFLTQCLNESGIYLKPGIDFLLFIWGWQVLVPVFMSLIALLEASMFIKVYGLYSLTGVVKLISASRCGKTMNVINTL